MPIRPTTAPSVRAGARPSQLCSFPQGQGQQRCRAPRSPRAAEERSALADTEPAQPPVVLLAGQSLSPALLAACQFAGRLERRPIVSPPHTPRSAAIPGSRARTMLPPISGGYVWMVLAFPDWRADPIAGCFGRDNWGLTHPRTPGNPVG